MWQISQIFNPVATPREQMSRQLRTTLWHKHDKRMPAWHYPMPAMHGSERLLHSNMKDFKETEKASQTNA